LGEEEDQKSLEMKLLLLGNKFEKREIHQILEEAL
jgi:hypothetical protein